MRLPLLPRAWVLSAAAVLLLLSLNAVIFANNARTLIDQQGLVTHTQNVLATVDRLRTNVVDAETGQRGYILTGQDSYLAPYTTARGQIARLLTHLALVTRGNSVQQQRLPQLKSLIQTRLTLLQRGITTRRSGGVTAAIKLVLKGHGKSTMDSIRGILDAMQATEDSLLSARTQAMHDAAQTLLVTLVVATLVDVVLLGGLVLSLQRSAARSRQTAEERMRLLEQEQAARVDAEQARRTAEEEHQVALLQRSRLEIVFEAMTDGVSVHDPNGNLVQLNSAMRALFGLHAQPAYATLPLDQRLRQLDMRDLHGNPIPPEQWVQRRVLHGEVLTGANGQDVVLRALDGRELQLNLSGAPIRDTHGQITGAVMVARDVTEQRRLEREKDDFLNTVSHDLKNPLTAITGMAQLMLRHAQRVEGAGSDRLVQGLTTIEQATRSMAQQINELLDISRLHMQRPLDLNLTPTDLVALLSQISKEYAHSSPRHTIHLETAQDSLSCICDPMRLHRAIANLLTNAMKYTPEGGDIRVTLARVDDTTGTWTNITVSDPGIGIPAEDIPHVFERFYRAGNVGTITGTGIGLAGVRQIVEQHGGTITISSVPRSGTSVTIRLPLANSSKEERSLGKELLGATVMDGEHH